MTPIFEVSNAELLPELSHEQIAMLLHAVAAEVPMQSTLAFSIAFVSMKAITALNATYRGIEKPTDVLSFRYSDDVAEIVLAPEIIRHHADQFKHPVSVEASFLLIHGVLHALGWDHERSFAEEKEMESYEQRILKRCGLPYPR